MTAQRMGGTVVVMEHFDPERCLALIEQHKVTHAQFVPTMFVRMLKLPDDVRDRYDLSSLRSVVHAAAPCAPEVKRRMIEWWGPVIHEYYSGTEGMGMTWITAAEALTHPGLGGQGHLGRGARLRRRRGGPPGRATTAWCTSPAAPAPPRSSTTTIPRRHARRSTTRVGPRCGTSATSTTRATCT